MFKRDDIVTYGTGGVCKIVAVEEKNLTGEKKTYFVLKPVYDEKSTFFVPIDNEKGSKKLRRLLSEDEINELIDSMPEEETLWIDNERERKERYRRIIAEANRSEMIGMIRAIHFEKERREEEGKKLHISDERFFKEAEKLLYEEFRYVLKLSEEDVMPYIFGRIENV